MKNKLSQNITYWLGVIAIGLVVGLSLQFVRAWTEPSVAPPGGNIGAPINTSNIGQSKEGNLIIATNPNLPGGGLKANGLIVQNGNVGIGTTTPSAKLTIDTNVPSYSASQLNLDSRDIKTSANEDLYVNWPNSSGNLMVGGEGENKDICAFRNGAWKCLSAAGGGGVSLNDLNPIPFGNLGRLLKNGASAYASCPYSTGTTCVMVSVGETKIENGTVWTRAYTKGGIPNGCVNQGYGACDSGWIQGYTTSCYKQNGSVIGKSTVVSTYDGISVTGGTNNNCSSSGTWK